MAALLMVMGRLRPFMAADGGAIAGLIAGLPGGHRLDCLDLFMNSITGYLAPI